MGIGGRHGHGTSRLQNTCPSHTGHVPSSMVSSLIPSRFRIQEFQAFRIIAETLKLSSELYRGEQGMFKKTNNNPTGSFSSINVLVQSLALCSFFSCLPSYISTVIKKKANKCISVGVVIIPVPNSPNQSPVWAPERS